MSTQSCPVCSKQIPNSQIEQHVEACLSGLDTTTNSNTNTNTNTNTRNNDNDNNMGICPICFFKFPQDKLSAHVDACLTGGGGGDKNKYEEKESDEELARRLQREETQQRQDRGVPCQACGTATALTELYILDDCTHKFCKKCLQASVRKQVATSVTTLCPLPGCKAALSVRDMKDMLPKQSEIESWAASGKGSAQATERLIQEMKYIKKTNPEKQGYSVAPIKNNLYFWEVKFFNFDKTDPIGQDLARSKHQHILLHVTFPKTYPFNPPFIRVIRPRFAFRTGHVTVGGSICTELLTNSGWSPANTVEAVLVNIRANLIVGGARLDLANRSDYSEAEAKEAFERMRQQYGW